MKLIGREEEQEIFAQGMASLKSEMIAVIGRRRVGKTFLIRKYFQKDIVFEFTGIYQGTLAEHTQQFLKVHEQYFKSTPTTKTKNWFHIFDHIEAAVNKINRKSKKVIFLDEIPWMGGSHTQFLKALGVFWNSWASKREDIVLVISGSTTSWMVKKIFKNKGGLHNRTTHRIYLNPFSLKEAQLFLKYKNCTLNQAAIAEIYMAVGGIPYYLEFIEPNQSVAQIIDKLYFKKTASLKEEFEELFSSLFASPEVYIKIVTILAKHNYGLQRNVLLKLLKLDSGGNFTKALFDLNYAGFITTYTPYGNKTKEKKYKLTDHFILFYLKFVSASKEITQWKKITSTQSYTIWGGFAFENLCLNHINQIEKALKIDGINTLVSFWYNKGNSEMHGAQIDLLIDRDDRIINLCEIKYYNGSVVLTKAMIDKINDKIISFKYFTNTNRSIFTTIICPNGIYNNKYSEQFKGNMVTLKDLFL